MPARYTQVIPFEGMRRDAGSIATEVDIRKDRATQYPYDTFEKQKLNLLREVANARLKIQKKEQEIADFKSRYPDGSTRPLEEELSKLKNDDEYYAKKAVETYNREKLEPAWDAWDRFWQARAGLREYFDKVLAKLKEAKSNPNTYLGANPSDADIARLKSCIETIESKINNEAPEHAKQEFGAKNNRDGFQALLQKNQ